MPIERPDSFKRLGLNPALSAAKFHESVSDFGIVYGLGVQALGLGRIDSNLLPKSVARSMSWMNKTKYFVGAACIVLVVSVLALARAIIDRTSYSSRSATRAKIQSVLSTARQAESSLEEERSRKRASEEVIKKEFDLFKNRDIIPLVNEEIIEALPNEKNNPQQSDLYEAFKRGDIATVMKTPREDRKQIFITGLSAYYTSDLETAQFVTEGLEREINVGEGGRRQGYNEAAMMEMMAQRGGGRVVQPSRTIRSRPTMGGSAGQTSENRGFVLTVSGYSPYKEIGKLLDPAGVQDDPTKWGVVTRLIHLDANSPFELYKKTDKEHFEIRTGDVGLDEEMPSGIGIRKVTEEADGQQKAELIDPMTNEVIGKQASADNTGRSIINRQGKAEYETGDHWFVLNLKLRWKSGTKSGMGPEAAEAGEASRARPPSQTSPPPAAAQPQERSSNRGRGGRNIDELE
jgi:type IV pilus assembly protein PilM